uniref:Uncharacterized protein n=1 Tax=Vitis vinifera TaxID=29760 RepID=A5ARS9_VITVI|nr:hypothetical protein VITISV_009401 [Vitis vinifera]
MADGEKDEAERGKHRRRRKGDRDIPGDEREGSPPKKMLCDWSPPEVEYSVAVSDAAEVGEKSWDRGRGKERGCDGGRKWSFLRTEMDEADVCIDIDLRER